MARLNALTIQGNTRFADAGLTRSGGALHLGDTPLTAIAEQVGTPVYVYNAAAIRERYRSLDAALGGLPHRICYAVKANSTLAVLRILRDLGADALVSLRDDVDDLSGSLRAASGGDGFDLALDPLWGDPAKAAIGAMKPFGRVVSLDMLGSFALLPLGFLLTGRLAESVGASPLILLYGLATVGVGVVGLLVPAVRRLE